MIGTWCVGLGVGGWCRVFGVRRVLWECRVWTGIQGRMEGGEKRFLHFVVRKKGLFVRDFWSVQILGVLKKM